MNLIRSGLIGLIRGYQLFLSPAIHFLVGNGSGCRFYPTCSEYAAVALRRHGVICGSELAVRRICRCHPWGNSGSDPVPEAPVNVSLVSICQKWTAKG